jgi:hypothetical protein
MIQCIKCGSRNFRIRNASVNATVDISLAKDFATSEDYEVEDTEYGDTTFEDDSDVECRGCERTISYSDWEDEAAEAAEALRIADEAEDGDSEGKDEVPADETTP